MCATEASCHSTLRLAHCTQPTNHKQHRTHLPEGTGVGSSEGAGVSGSTSGSGASAEAGFWWMKSRACTIVGTALGLYSTSPVNLVCSDGR